MNNARTKSGCDVPDNTGEKQATRFQPGRSGNLAGRPRGSRNRVVQTIVDLYTASLEGTGAEDLERLRQKDLSTYWRLAMQFVPSKIESLLDVTVHHELSEEFEKAATPLFPTWNDRCGSFSTVLVVIAGWLMSAPVRKRRTKGRPGALRLAGLP